MHHRGLWAQQRLAEALGVSARHVTGLVDALQSEGSARRLPRPRDRWVVPVELTGKGAARVVQMQRQRGKDAAALVGGLDARSVEDLRSSLDTILIRLRRLVADSNGNGGGVAR